MEHCNIKIEDIIKSDNSRMNMKDRELADLMAGIKEEGLLQNIVVAKTTGGKYKIVAGNRRLEAVTKLGWKEIPCSVIEDDGDNSLFVKNLQENVLRKDLNPTEEGLAYIKLMKDFGMSESEISARICVPIGRVNNLIDLAKNIPVYFRDKIRTPKDNRRKEGYVSPTVAVYVLNAIKEHKLLSKEAKALFDYSTKDGVSKEQIRNAAVNLSLSKSNPFEDASQIKRVVVQLYLNIKQVKKLENRYHKKVNQIFFDELRSNKAFGILNRGNRKSAHTVKKIYDEFETADV